MTAAAKTATYGQASVTLTRIFDAPRALVWKAWTDPKMMAQWFGPRGFTNPVCDLDVRVGGSLAHRDARAGRQRVSNERRVSRGYSAGAACVHEYRHRQDGKHLLEGETTVILSESNGKTTLTLQTHAIGLVPIAPQMLAGMEAGWNQSIDKLAELFLRSAAR